MQTSKPNAWTWSRVTILVVAVLELLNWGAYLPSLFLRPLSEIPTDGVAGLLMLFILMVFPVLAASAAELAIRGQRLRIAAVLVGIQPLIWLLTVIGFAIGVTNYGCENCIEHVLS
jgi:hypothetical protein